MAASATKKVDLGLTGTQTFAKVEKIVRELNRDTRISAENWTKPNAELFTLTYGAIVSQLLKDCEKVEEVNNQLEKMGYNIGLRLVDDFLAKSALGRCQEFKDTADVIAKVGFKMFLNVTASVSGFDSKKNQFSLLIEENPLTDFVELPDEYKDSLWYSNILCGVIRGALEMLQMRVECEFVKDTVRGDDISEIRVRLIEILKDEIPAE